MDEVKVIDGEIFRDARGQINSLNSFRFDEIKRCYIIHHPDVTVVRGWNAHRNERKWFYCVKGRFSVALVKIDDWEKPSESLSPDVYHLSDENSRLICVPKGYANSLKAWIPGSVMLVLSDRTMDEAADDNWKYDRNLWINWDKINKDK